MAWRSSSSLWMPNSVSSACSALAASTPSLRHAFSQPVSRMRWPAPALTIHSRCSFSEAPIRPCKAVGARPGVGLRRIGKETKHPSGVADRPGRIPAQRRVPVAQIFRQRIPQRRIVQRRDRTAAENAGIAVGGFAAGLAPVDQDDRHPALPRGIGRRDADDARAQHDDIRLACPLPSDIGLPQTPHINVRPPSTGNSAPVTCPASGDNRKATTAATSSGSANRCKRIGLGRDLPGLRVQRAKTPGVLAGKAGHHGIGRRARTWRVRSRGI